MEPKTMEYQAPWGTETVQLEINSYMNNNGLYIGMLSKEEDGFEPYGDMTVNLTEKAPDYCAYLDTNNLSGIEKFVVDNDLGEFTGFTQRSGFCEFPLYMFNVDKLRELCPDGMQAYEDSIGAKKAPEVKEKAR